MRSSKRYELEPKEHTSYASAFASLGGKARAAKLSKARQSEIGQTAAAARWAGHRKKNRPTQK